MWLWWRGTSVQSSTYLTKDFLPVKWSWCHHEGIESFSRYEEMWGLGTWNQFLKTPDFLKTCSTSFPGVQSMSFSTLNSLQGHAETCIFIRTPCGDAERHRHTRKVVWYLRPRSYKPRNAEGNLAGRGIERLPLRAFGREHSSASTFISDFQPPQLWGKAFQATRVWPSDRAALGHQYNTYTLWYSSPCF